MKKLRWALLGVAASALVVVAGATAQANTFVATLSGAEEVPARPSAGTGSAVLIYDGAGLSYQLNVANINNVVAAHIHVGRPGENGPVVFTLFGRTPPGISFTSLGLLASGRGTQLEGPLAGQPMSVLVAQMEAGNAYVNVHTNDAVPPTDTGPGDFPGGEIRGQVRVADRTTGGATGGTGGLAPGGRRGRGR
jgi:CHRD domain